MKPGAFGYGRAESVAEAVALLEEHGDEAKLIAGGQSLVPMLNLRLARPAFLVDIDRLPLSHVSVEGDTVRLGANVRHHHLEHAAVVAEAVPLFARAAPLIGHPAIRNRGTLGGSIAHADAAAELPAVAVALDARFELQSSDGSRAVEAAAFFDGPFMTAIGEAEVLVAVQVPWHGDWRCTYEEMAIRAGDFALVGVAAAVRVDADGVVSDVRLALSGVAGVPVRADEAERVIAGSQLTSRTIAEAADAARASAAGAPEDVHASAEYRQALAAVLTKRALEKLSRESQR